LIERIRSGLTVTLRQARAPIRRLRLRRYRLPIAALLIFGLSGLITVAVASVLYLGVWTSRTNAVDLARDRAALITAVVTSRINQALDPAREQVGYLAETIIRQHIDPLKDPRFLDIVGGALGTTRQITAIAFATPDYHLLRVFRGPDGPIDHGITLETSPAIRAAIDSSRLAPGPFWGDVIWSDEAKQPLINLRAPVRNPDGSFVGTLYAVLSVADLSAVLADIRTEFGATAFILLDHDLVLAHPSLVKGFPGQSRETPLPRYDEIGDPVLARIWDQGTWLDRERSERLLGGHARMTEIDGRNYLFLYDRTIEYGPRPWLIGTYLQETTLSAALNRTMDALAAGTTILVLAAVCAWLVGRRLTRQIQSLASAAHSVRDFEFAHVTRLPPSRLRELDDAGRAFNAMIDGLRWFETYVPRALVRRLIRLGAHGNVESVEREVTVMFTDIAGYTTLSEKMAATEVANFLNAHFALIDRCIDEAGGTVDKHLGDGVMAFWGAPEIQADHAERAVRAARAIVDAVAADNKRLRAKGGIPVRIRIGIHSGLATVGNVGGPSRMSYTIIGDTVNSAERLCDLGKQAAPGDYDVVVLVSGDTAAELADTADLKPFSEQVLRGRHRPTKIFRLAT
jgi:class 3 adenylate cyclase/HAMP domain-containing protein